MIEDALATAAALWVFDKFIKPHVMNADDPEWMHLAKQTGTVVGCTKIVDLARSNGWIPHIFG